MFATILAAHVIAAPDYFDPRSSPREARRIAVVGEAGWNGLAGVGVNGIFHVTPRLALDGGVGLGGTGEKLGLRVRLNLLTTVVTPFVGAGLMLASGTFDKEITVDSSDGYQKLVITVKPSAFGQFVAGLDVTTRGGFTLLAMAGWAQLLSGDNVSVKSGWPTHRDETVFDIAYRSGIVLAVAGGYAF